MSKRLLVVDDALIIREMIKNAATAAGWEIVGEGSDGAQALALYEQHRPDAMTLDLVMPKFDGMYALRNILSRYPDAKIVVVSALEQRTVLTESFKLGAADFVVKPFQKQALLDTLDQLVPDTADARVGS